VAAFNRNGVRIWGKKGPDQDGIHSATKKDFLWTQRECLLRSSRWPLLRNYETGNRNDPGRHYSRCYLAAGGHFKANHDSLEGSFE
jgi:hypothetical protein